MQPGQARTRRISTNFHARITLGEPLEKKLMSRLVPKNAGARMATFSTTTHRKFRTLGRHEVMSTLVVVEEVLRETPVPMSVREIVERAGARLPSKSKTPDTVVARDLAMDIKKKGESSLFVRTSPGRYTLRALGHGEATTPLTTAVRETAQPSAASNSTIPMGTLGTRKPAAPAAPARPLGRTDSAEGGGYVG
jgi:hypothetical protein